MGPAERERASFAATRNFRAWSSRSRRALRFRADLPRDRRTKLRISTGAFTGRCEQTGTYSQAIPQLVERVGDSKVGFMTLIFSSRKRREKKICRIVTNLRRLRFTRL
jgi:hypothetical protein